MAYGITCVGAENTITLAENTTLYNYIGKFYGSSRDRVNDESPDFYAVSQSYTHHVKIPKLSGETERPMAFCDIPYTSAAATPSSEYVAGAAIVAVLDGDLETGQASWTAGNWVIILAARAHTPTVRVFRRWNKAASSEAYGLRVFDGSGNLTFDSGHRFLWLVGHGSIGFSYPYNSGNTIIEPVNKSPLHGAGMSFSLTSSAGCSKRWNSGQGPANHPIYGGSRNICKMLAHNGSDTYLRWGYTSGATGAVSSYIAVAKLNYQTSVPFMAIDNSAFP